VGDNSPEEAHMNDNVGLVGKRNGRSTIGTFEVSVKFMQNSTWQGQIHWIENDQKQNFRSALELLKLMDEALTAGNDKRQSLNW
jgi:hypothetical protein